MESKKQQETPEPVGPVRSITWEASEHHHVEKGSDWYWALGIVAIAATVAAIMFSNALFGLVILLAAIVLGFVSLRVPKTIEFAVTGRGVRIGGELFPYTTLESFFIDEEDPRGPQLLIKSERLFMPLIVMPLPEEYVDDIDDLLGTRLEEEHLEESIAQRALEFFGF